MTSQAMAVGLTVAERMTAHVAIVKIFRSGTRAKKAAMLPTKHRGSRKNDPKSNAN
jgi:hypothetical protein